HIAVVFALEGWITERLEFFTREAPGTSRQAVGSAVAIRDFLDRAPIFRPLHLGQLLQRADLAERYLGLVQLRVQSADITEGQDPGLHDMMQLREMQPARCRSSKARVVRKVGAPHGPQI